MSRARKQLEISLEPGPPRPSNQDSALLCCAFLPMFLAAGSGAVTALAIWPAAFFGEIELPIRFDSLTWLDLACPATLIAGGLWVAAFVLFELVYAPILLTQRSGS
jgi:uncharacterized protein involved in response to NO